MRESAFREKLFMILSIGDKRVRNYLLPRLGEPRAPAPSAASEAAAPALGALPHSADAVHSASDPDPDPVHGPALPAQHVAPADA